MDDILRRAMSGKGDQAQNEFFLLLHNRKDIPRTQARNLSPNRILCGLLHSARHTLLRMRWKLSEFVLKVYYPIEFMVAVINNQGGFIEQYVHEAKMSGATIHNPCVNKVNFPLHLI
jgi:DNA polymerase-3 subunit alpha/error-prone DNA polymerase